MSGWKRRLPKLIITVFILLVLLLPLSLIGTNFLVEIWWFDSLGYLFYFFQRLLYRYVVFGTVTLAFFLIFFLNFWVASRYLGTSSAPASSDKKSSRLATRELFRAFRTGSMWVYTPLSLILAVPISLPLFNKWESFLLYLSAPRMGVADPTYGNDISYYFFSYPIYTLIQRRLLIAFVLLLAALLVLYWLERRLLSGQDQRLPGGARWHLCILVMLIFIIEVGDYVLQRHTLLFDGSHMPLFYGPGFTEMRVILPLIWISLLLLLATSFSFIYFIQTHKGFKLLALFAIVFALSLGLRYSSWLPETVQKYIVKPNEISRERTYIERNIQATLAAYNLENVEIRSFSPMNLPQEGVSANIKAILRNTPVWDGELLESVYKQLQELRTYYDFPSVDVGRYTVNNIYQQVFLSAREINPEQLPAGARNWVNEHLSYTHGFGVVMTPASQDGDEPMTWFLSGIPPESEYGFRIEQPRIYFGAGKYPYVIAPNDAGEIDYPKGDSNVMTNYDGKGGVPITSLFRKAVFAYYFNDKDILFTTKTNARSRILFRQNIVERIRTITPFLSLDNDPYLVVTPKKLYWMQDAYTTSNLYPNATPYTPEAGPINYIRNSIKIVVDAYDGTVGYYIFDEKDPVVRAYSRIYPGLFKSVDQMPQELAVQVRYPQDIFQIQMDIYANYHQTDPDVFYQQEDIWEPAKSYRAQETLSFRPYYLTLDLIQPGRFDFLLLDPMSPKGRDNLRALAIAGSDKPYYGKIIVYDFPKGELVYGPSQIYSLINQDTRIAEQFTLWDQVGSEVARGKMIILPIGKTILYIQPVYLKSATQLKIPELKRHIMSQGQIVVMDASLEGAYVALEERIRLDAQRRDRRFAPLLPGAPPTGESTPPAHKE